MSGPEAGQGTLRSRVPESEGETLRSGTGGREGRGGNRRRGPPTAHTAPRPPSPVRDLSGALLPVLGGGGSGGPGPPRALESKIWPPRTDLPPPPTQTGSQAPAVPGSHRSSPVLGPARGGGERISRARPVSPCSTRRERGRASPRAPLATRRSPVPTPGAKGGPRRGRRARGRHGGGKGREGRGGRRRRRSSAEAREGGRQAGGASRRGVAPRPWTSLRPPAPVEAGRRRPALSVGPPEATGAALSGLGAAPGRRHSPRRPEALGGEGRPPVRPRPARPLSRRTPTPRSGSGSHGWAQAIVSM